MTRPHLGRAFHRWLYEIGGVGSVDDVRQRPGARCLDRVTVTRYASEAERMGLVRGYPGLPGEGVQYVVGGREAPDTRPDTPR